MDPGSGRAARSPIRWQARLDLEPRPFVSAYRCDAPRGQLLSSSRRLPCMPRSCRGILLSGRHEHAGGVGRPCGEDQHARLRNGWCLHRQCGNLPCRRVDSGCAWVALNLLRIGRLRCWLVCAVFAAHIALPNSRPNASIPAHFRCRTRAPGPALRRRVRATPVAGRRGRRRADCVWGWAQARGRMHICAVGENCQGGW